jgi:hypothetical protein
MAEEAKNAITIDDFDSKFEQAYNQDADDEQETHEESSPSKQTTGEETEESETHEDETSQKSEEKTEETEETPKEFHKHPAWQRILKERDEARAQLQEFKGKSNIQDEKLEKLDKLLNSPEFIRMSMKQEGYTDEAINKKLSEQGHSVERDLGLKDYIFTKLGVDPNNLRNVDLSKVSPEALVEDFIAMADLAAEYKIAKMKESELAPLQQKISQRDQEAAAQKLTGKMEEEVKSRGILDFNKDIEPKIHEYLDKNPTATQSEVYNYFKQIHADISIDRLQKGSKAQDRKDKKNANRTNVTSGMVSKDASSIQKTGNYSDDFDSLWEQGAHLME